MSLVISALLLCVFIANVVMGAQAERFLGDVGEMVTLLAASIAFVIGVLKREADERIRNENSEPGGPHGL